MTAAGRSLYSRAVTWLKVLLPIGALAILSSVVLIARDAEDRRTIPYFEEADRPERVAAPEYQGLTDDGAAITIVADEVLPLDGSLRRFDAMTVSSRLETPSGRVIDAAAPEGRVDLDADVAVLTGAVEVATSDGYSFQAEGLITDLSATHAQSEGPVNGNAPFGTIVAGRMLFEPGRTGDVLLFSDGVRLVYRPRGRTASK